MPEFHRGDPFGNAKGPQAEPPLPAAEFCALPGGKPLQGSVLDAGKVAFHLFRQIRDELFHPAEQIFAASNPKDQIRLRLATMLEPVVRNEGFEAVVVMIGNWLRNKPDSVTTNADRESLKQAVASMDWLHRAAGEFPDASNLRYHVLDTLAPLTLRTGALGHFRSVLLGDDLPLLKLVLQQRLTPLGQRVNAPLGKPDSPFAIEPDIARKLRAQTRILLNEIPAETMLNADEEMRRYLGDCKKAWEL